MDEISATSKTEEYPDKDGSMKAALAESGLVVDFLRCTEKFKNYYYTGTIKYLE